MKDGHWIAKVKRSVSLLELLLLGVIPSCYLIYPDLDNRTYTVPH
jgi:hypothetical protein